MQGGTHQSAKVHRQMPNILWVLNGFVALDHDLIGAQQHFARRRDNGPGRTLGAHMQADLTCSATGEPQ